MTKTEINTKASNLTHEAATISKDTLIFLDQLIDRFVMLDEREYARKMFLQLLRTERLIAATQEIQSITEMMKGVKE